jgi:hypothetical protein
MARDETVPQPAISSLVKATKRWLFCLHGHGICAKILEQGRGTIEMLAKIHPGKGLWRVLCNFSRVRHQPGQDQTARILSKTHGHEPATVGLRCRGSRPKEDGHGGKQVIPTVSKRRSLVLCQSHLIRLKQRPRNCTDFGSCYLIKSNGTRSCANAGNGSDLTGEAWARYVANWVPNTVVLLSHYRCGLKCLIRASLPGSQ